MVWSRHDPYNHTRPDAQVYTISSDETGTHMVPDITTARVWYLPCAACGDPVASADLVLFALEPQNRYERQGLLEGLCGDCALDRQADLLACGWTIVHIPVVPGATPFGRLNRKK